MISVNEMQAKLEAIKALSLKTHYVPLSCGLNRRLAQDITADHNVPPADNSAMDGYAVRLCDLTTNDSLTVSQRIPAGTVPSALQAGTCARIFTGAELPAGADTVIMQENTFEEGDAIRFLASIPDALGINVRPKGQDITAGQILARQGTKITPALLGLLASQGLNTLPVQRPLVVTLLSTGNEIIEPGLPIAAGQIYNSNFSAISSLLDTWGFVDIKYQHVADSLAETLTAFDQSSRESDLVISFGGVSVGEEDHVKSAISQLGKLDQWRIKLKPGKPLMMASVNDTPILGLPGNPVSAFVTFLLFGKRLLNALCNTQIQKELSFQVPLGFNINKARQRPEYIRANILNGEVVSAGNQSSGVLSSLNQCQGLALIPEDQCIQQGECITFFPMESLIHA